MLVVVFSLKTFFGTASQVAACVVFSVLHLYSHYWYLPYYKPVVNMVYVIHGMIFASATVFTIIALLRGVPEVCTRRAQLLFVGGRYGLISSYLEPSRVWMCEQSQTNAEAISCLASLPVVMFLGYAVTRFRFESFMKPKVVDSPYLVGA